VPRHKERKRDSLRVAGVDGVCREREKDSLRVVGVDSVCHVCTDHQ